MKESFKALYPNGCLCWHKTEGYPWWPVKIFHDLKDAVDYGFTIQRQELEEHERVFLIYLDSPRTCKVARIDFNSFRLWRSMDIKTIVHTSKHLVRLKKAISNARREECEPSVRLPEAPVRQKRPRQQLPAHEAFGRHVVDNDSDIYTLRTFRPQYYLSEGWRPELEGPPAPSDEEYVRLQSSSSRAGHTSADSGHYTWAYYAIFNAITVLCSERLLDEESILDADYRMSKRDKEKLCIQLISTCLVKVIEGIRSYGVDYISFLRSLAILPPIIRSGTDILFKHISHHGVIDESLLKSVYDHFPKKQLLFLLSQKALSLVKSQGDEIDDQQEDDQQEDIRALKRSKAKEEFFEEVNTGVGSSRDVVENSDPVAPPHSNLTTPEHDAPDMNSSASSYEEPYSTSSERFKRQYKVFASLKATGTHPRLLWSTLRKSVQGESSTDRDQFIHVLDDAVAGNAMKEEVAIPYC